jgi:hypothetical protein
MRITINGCGSQSVSVVSQPLDLVIPRSLVANTTVEALLTPDYASLLVSSEPSGCPFILYELHDSAGASFDSEDVTLVSQEDPALAALVIKDDAPFTLTLRIIGYLGVPSNFITLSIQVCGAETVALVDPTKKTLLLTKEEGAVASMSDATRYHTIDEATFATYFALGPVGDACVVDVYEIYQGDVNSTQIWSPLDTRVMLDGSLGSFEFQVDKSQSGFDAASVFLRATTMGMHEATQELEFEVCSVNDIVKHTASIVEVLSLDQSSDLVSEVVYTASIIAEVISSDCSLCPLSHFRLLNADSTAYLGSVVSLDADNNLVVLTDTPFS